MSALMPVSDALANLVARIGRVGSWLFVPLILVIMFDVITRKFGLVTSLREYFIVGGMPGAAAVIDGYFTSTKLQELEWHLHAALFLLCLGFGYVRNSHVRIELVREKLDRDTRAWMEIIGCTVFLAPYCGLVFYYGLDFAHRSYAMGEVSSALTGLGHRWIIKSFVPIGMAVLFTAAVAVVLRNLAYLLGDAQQKERVMVSAVELHDMVEELRRIAAAKELAQ